LMPGLADMHMHLMGDSLVNDPEQVLLFLQTGTTTVRSLGSPPSVIPWREQVIDGELVGPTIYTAGRTFVANANNQTGLALYFIVLNIARLLLPLLLGGVVFLIFKQICSPQTALIGGGILLALGLVLFFTKTPSIMTFAAAFDAPHAFLPETTAQASAEMDQQQNAWDVDLIKVYDGLSEKQYLDIVADAKSRDIYVTGHLLDQVPLEAQLTNGRDEVAHIDEFLSHHWIGYNGGVNPDPAYAETFDFPLDYDAIPQTVQLVAENDRVVVSNMSTDEAMVNLILDTEGTLAGEEYQNTYPVLVDAWSARGRHLTVFADAGERRRDVEMPFYMELTKALHDEGVLIILGTDSGGFQPEGSLPSQIHREVELLVEAGFSNYDALAAGTRNAGIVVERMGRDGNFGTVEVGQRADLILLTENPLDNVSATRDRMGVMTRGRWYSQADLDAMVDEHLATFR